MDLNNQLIKIVINKHEIIYVQCICLKYKIKCIILYLSQCTNFWVLRLVHVIWTNVKIGLECQIFLIVISFNCGRVLKFGAQTRSFLVICTTFMSEFFVGWKNQNEYSTLNLSFDTLFKWHEPDIRQTSIHVGPGGHFHLQIVVSIWSRKENPKWPILEITRQ